MAFDRPLEADRVDDLGLLSTFVRAPIVGPIMWILGKKLAENDNEEEKENSLSIDRKTQDGTSSSATKRNLQSTRASGSFPDIARLSIDDIMNASSSSLEDRANNGQEESNNATNYINNSNGKLVPADEETKHNEAFNSIQIRKKSRKMSWSDESGQSLVEYCNLSQSSTSHNLNTPPSQSYYPTSSSNKKPIKSAMRRSAGNNSSGKPTTRFHPSQCVPKGLSGGSIIMPTGGGLQQGQQQYHNQQPSNGNGYISPQYGWYISMTPPTPPHYHETHSSSMATLKKEIPLQHQEQQILQQNQLNGKMNPQHHQYILPMSNNNNGGKPVSHVLGQPPTAPPRPVFTRSLKGVPNNTSGWPSVPL